MPHYFVLYSYRESPPAAKNLRFFIAQAVDQSPDVAYLFVINGHECSVPLPNYSNVRVLKRDNVGHDFGGWSDACNYLRRDRHPTDAKYIFINDTVRGPFIPRYVPRRIPWYEQFTNLLSNRVKLCGTTINSRPWDHVSTTNNPGSDRLLNAHVQSMAFCLDSVGLERGLLPILSHPKEMHELYARDRKAFIIKYEIGLSKAILDAGFEIAALYMADMDKSITGDVWWDKGYYGTSMNPFETMFVKTSRYESATLDLYCRQLCQKS